MNQSQFEHHMHKAKALIEDQDYLAGYQRGLRRHYHGEAFGTEQEHELWLSLVGDEDPSRAAIGRGYRAGFYFKDYCVQNDGDCTTCSLVNYGRDCRNNPI